MLARRIPLTGSLVALLIAATAAPAAAQLKEVDVDTSSTAELYIRKRPSTPEAPTVPEVLQKLLAEKEQARDAKRTEAIGLLRGFLEQNPQGDSRADALFKLAELLWEDARRKFILDMDEYERKLEVCRLDRKKCKKPPKEPRISLEEPAKHYRTILADHPTFRRTDLVLYLVGFAATEKGKQQEAMGFFNQVIERFPQSPLFGDAWMMIGEHHFNGSRWQEAHDAFANILSRPESATYDLALFKTAWCDWKLGDVDKAAERFTEVLNLAVQAETSGSIKDRDRLNRLRDEALEYLVIVFTEDRAVTAKEVYEFLGSIGGERYSKDVLVRVANAYKDQTEFDRSNDTFRFLINLQPEHIEAAEYQRNIVQNRIDELDQEQTIVEIKELVKTYGPQSKWAKANKKYPSRVARSLARTEKLVRETAKRYHAEAQQDEKKRAKRRGPKFDVKLYTRAADTYAFYLESYDEHENATEVRFLRAEILYFKLQKLEAAGDEYLAVGKTKPKDEKQKQELHKDALLKAMEAFEKARPKKIDKSKKRELLPVDRKFAETVDLYATLFPADPELVGVIFRNGQLFYDYGDYDEAIKRFGLIVTKYPDDPNAGPAGDRILSALAQGEDYENIENWARKLQKAKAFQSKDQQARLERLIVESIGKSGEKYAAAKDYEKAATFYLRIPKEFPKHKLAASSFMNAGVMYEKAKNPEKAATTYLDLAKKFPKAKNAPKAAFTAGQVYESVAYFDRAAEAYETVVKDFPKKKQSADALFNAGLLRQALGQHDKAIEHYNLYAKRYRKRKDAKNVAFRVAVVYQDAGKHDEAYKAFAAYAKANRRSSGRALMEAHVRAGRSANELGREKVASRHLKTVLTMYKKRRKKKSKAAVADLAAEARYLQGEIIFRQFQALKLDVSPKKLERTLNKKTSLLDKAQTAYIDVVDYNDSQWAVAALFRIGSIYDEFAESMRTAPPPPGLSEEQVTMYREALDNTVIEVEERSIELYTMGYEKALELKVYNQYTSKMRDALGRLDSGTFPPVNEARPTERFGDRPLDPVLVKEVVRDE